MQNLGIGQSSQLENFGLSVVERLQVVIADR
jgi:hypothetical protein